MLIGALVAIALLLLFSPKSLIWRANEFEAGLEWTGRTSDNYSAFALSVTNKGVATGGPKRVKFQWIDRAGRIDSCHADLNQPEKQCSGVLTAHIGVPADAKKVRVLLCHPPGPTQKEVQSLLQKLPGRLQSLFPQKWFYPYDTYSPLLPWTINPTLKAAGTRNEHLLYRPHQSQVIWQS